jgi:hypothetical protein
MIPRYTEIDRVNFTFYPKLYICDINLFILPLLEALDLHFYAFPLSKV